jgi:CheY-like chemotaxis protein
MAVDDEPDITFTLKKELEQNGFSLDVFNDPLAALSNFKADYYDLILLDVHMPQMNGLELYQEINKKDKNVKACFVTSYELHYESGETTLVPRTMSKEFKNALPKPSIAAFFASIGLPDKSVVFKNNSFLHID